MSTSEPQEGSHVVVLSLKRRGVVTRCLRGGAFVVALGAMTITVRSDDLELCEPQRQSSDAAQRERLLASVGRKRRTPTVLDLHGYTVDEAIRALETWLNESIVAGSTQLQVIHGLGSGRVQKAVHTTLARYSAVRAYRINDVNPGATDIFIG